MFQSAPTSHDIYLQNLYKFQQITIFLWFSYGFPMVFLWISRCAAPSLRLSRYSTGYPKIAGATRSTLTCHFAVLSLFEAIGNHRKTIGKPQENAGFPWELMGQKPSGNLTVTSLWKITIEIVDFPMNSMVDLSSSLR